MILPEKVDGFMARRAPSRRVNDSRSRSAIGGNCRSPRCSRIDRGAPRRESSSIAAARPSFDGTFSSAEPFARFLASAARERPIAAEAGFQAELADEDSGVADIVKDY